MRSRNATSTAWCSPTATAIGSACVLWAAGVMASRAAKWLERRGRPRRPRHRRRRPQRARPSRDLRHRRHRCRSRARTASRCPASRRPPSRWAATSRRLIKARLAGAAGQAVPLYRLRQPRHDRPQGGGRRFRPDQADRLSRLAAVELRASVVPGRLPQPHRRVPRLGMGLCDLRPRRAPHHRTPRDLKAPFPPAVDFAHTI